MSGNSSQKEKRGNYSIIGFILLFLIGAGILFYPRISFWLADYNHVAAYQTYERSVANLGSAEKLGLWEQAVNYNERLVTSSVMDPFAATKDIDPFDEYFDTLDVGDGMMGSIRIPEIDVLIPLYHGVSDEVLDKGIGHIKATALPVGGLGTHGVLTGHTGLSHAKMFNDLVELEIGDEFYLEILDETLAYKVERIVTVLPDDVSMLKREADQDRVTLITCTPYGVNSHRLLVMGERTEYNASEGDRGIDKAQFPWWIIAVVVSLLILLLIIGRAINKHNKKQRRERS